MQERREQLTEEADASNWESHIQKSDEFAGRYYTPRTAYPGHPDVFKDDFLLWTKDNPNYTYTDEHKTLVAVMDLEWVTYQVPLSKLDQKDNDWKGVQRQPSKHISELCCVSIDGSILFSRYVKYKPLHPHWRQLQDIGRVSIDPSDDDTKAKSWYQVFVEWMRAFPKGTVFYYHGSKDPSSIRENIELWGNIFERDRMKLLLEESQYRFVSSQSILNQLFVKCRLFLDRAGKRSLLARRKLNVIYYELFQNSLLRETNPDGVTKVKGNWKVHKTVSEYFENNEYDQLDPFSWFEYERYGRFSVLNKPADECIQFLDDLKPEFHTAHTDAHILRHILVAACLFAQCMRRMVDTVQPYYDIETTLWVEQGKPLEEFPVTVFEYAHACVMTSMMTAMGHLRSHFIGCSQEAAKFLHYEGVKAASLNERRRAVVKMPKLEQPAGAPGKWYSQTVLPWQPRQSRAVFNALQKELSQDYYDDVTNTWVVVDKKDMNGRFEQHLAKVKGRVGDAPLWFAPGASTRRVRQARILHCYHCPSLWNVKDPMFLDINSTVSLHEYVFCKLCKKFQDLGDYEQNVIHKGVFGDDEKLDLVGEARLRAQEAPAAPKVNATQQDVEDKKDIKFDLDITVRRLRRLRISNDPQRTIDQVSIALLLACMQKLSNP